MKASLKIASQFLNSAIEWASAEPEIDALALVGSHARGNPRPDSDVDLVVLSKNRDGFMTNLTWLTQFGRIRSHHVENWEVIQSLRVFFVNGLEVEFGFGDLQWAAVAVDSGTRKVISKGFRVLYDPLRLLQKLQVSIDAQ